MIPFDGKFAEQYVYPLAHGAYDATQAPPGHTIGTDAFEILADLGPLFQARLEKADPRHRKALKSMLDHPRQPHITDASKATSASVQAMARSAKPNQHFGWLCVDSKNKRLIVAFRGTEFFRDWLNDFDFAPEPYSPIPGHGTVHQGFQIVYEAVRENVRKLVQSKAPGCTELLITGHSLGGALCALAAPDLLNDVAANLAPTVYTWAEPRVGHPDFVRFFDSRVNVCPQPRAHHRLRTRHRRLERKTSRPRQPSLRKDCLEVHEPAGIRLTTPPPPPKMFPLVSDHWSLVTTHV